MQYRNNQLQTFKRHVTADICYKKAFTFVCCGTEP